MSLIPGRRFLQVVFCPPGLFFPGSCLCFPVPMLRVTVTQVRVDSVNTSDHYCSYRCSSPHYRTPDGNTSQAHHHIFKATLSPMHPFHTLPFYPTRCSQDTLLLSEEHGGGFFHFRLTPRVLVREWFLGQIRYAGNCSAVPEEGSCHVLVGRVNPFNGRESKRAAEAGC